jgi:hypothetical protein
MANCAICNTEIKRMNKPFFGHGSLNDGNEICTECHGEIDMEDVRKFSSAEVKLIFLGEKSPGEIVKDRLKTEMELDSRPNTEPALEPDSSKMEFAPDDSFSVDNQKSVKKKILRDKIIVFVVSLLIVGGGMAVISNWWNNLGASTLNLTDPKSLIGTYNGSITIAGAKFNVTLIIESANSCKIRYTGNATGWDRYTMRIDKENNKIDLSDGSELKPSGGSGFFVYDSGVLICIVTKEK